MSKKPNSKKLKVYLYNKHTDYRGVKNGYAKGKVLAANLSLPLHQLVTFTLGNVSGVDKKVSWLLNLLGSNTIEMGIADMVVVDLQSGEVIDDGHRNPL